MLVYLRTQILDINCTLIPQSRIVNLDIPHIIDRCAVAPLGHSQPMNREFGCLGNLLEDFRSGRIRTDSYAFR